MNHRKVYSRSGVFAWSGAGISNGGIAIAEAAQQIDLFRDSVTSFFDFLSVDDILRGEPAVQLKPTSSAAVDFKFNDLAWAPFCTNEHPSGLIIGCGESGHTSVFDAAALKGGKLQCLGVRSYHQGHVLSVSVNSVNPKWVCTGGAMGSVLLWDLNEPLNAVTPGKPNFEHQIKCVSWNRCSEHLLGSLTNQRCSIWDLRAPGAPALDIGDIGGSIEWSTMKWSPVCGTELCLASQNDQAPLITKWDLRYASSALLAYQVHNRGVFAMDWCPKDPDILVTVGKDEQIIFQNPNTQELLGSMKTSGWARKLSWCHTNPNLFAISYYDQPVTIYSISPFGSAIETAKNAEGAHFELSLIPAWLRPGSCGASFSFGNRLCSFFKEQNAYNTNSQSIVSYGLVEGDEVNRDWASKLITVLQTNQLAEYCAKEAESSKYKSKPEVALLWSFLSARSLSSSRSALLNTLNNLFVKERSTHHEVENVIAQMNEFCLESNKQGNDDEIPETEGSTICLSKVRKIEPPVFSSLISTSDTPQGGRNVSLKLLFSIESVFGGYSLPSYHKPNLLGILCCDTYMVGIAKALLEKNYLFALLLGFTADDQNTLKFIGHTIANDSSVDSVTRVVALMAAGMWEELLELWDIQDWISLLQLILSQAPAEKTSVLCRKLACKMRLQGIGLNAAIPAIAGSDVESLLLASESLSVQERIALANILRQSLGGGSLHIVSVGPEYAAVLGNCVNELVKEGFVEEAWQLLEPIDVQNCKEELRELKYTLYEALDKPGKTIVCEDPYTRVRAAYSGTGNLPSSKNVNFYRAVKETGYRAVNETIPNHFSNITQFTTPFQNIQNSGFPQPSLSGYSQHPTPSNFMPSTQPPPLNMFPSSVYSQPSPAAYSSLNYSSPVMSMQNAVTVPPFSQTSQPLSSQNLYSTPASIPPPPVRMQSGGDIQFSYGGRTRTLSSSSYSSGRHPQFVQDPSINATYPNRTTPELPPQQFPLQGSPLAAHGWNDPPPIALKKSSAPATVAEIKWKPAIIDEKAPSVPEKKLLPQPTYSLNEADSYVVNVLSGMISIIRQADRSLIIANKTTDIEQKISAELVPRLSRGAFSSETVALLQEFARHMSVYDFQSCQLLISKLVGGRDFVELSPSMPGLRALLQLAQKTFTRH